MIQTRAHLCATLYSMNTFDGTGCKMLHPQNEISHTLTPYQNTEITAVTIYLSCERCSRRNHLLFKMKCVMSWSLYFHPLEGGHERQPRSRLQTFVSMIDKMYPSVLWCADASVLNRWTLLPKRRIRNQVTFLVGSSYCQTF